MKPKIRICLCVLLALILAAGVLPVPSLAADAVPVDAGHFPDAAFRDWVRSLDTDSDGLLSEQEADCNTVSVGNMGISDLTGIEYFPKIRNLYCDSNPIAELDLSGNPDLIHISCLGCGMENLDVHACTNLYRLDCLGNNLIELDLRSCPMLESLNCSDNQLAFLDVTQNPSLKTLQLERNRVYTLDVSGCPGLEGLACSLNPISELNLDGNPDLNWLYCGNCRLEKLDVSDQARLEYLRCSNNQMRSLILPPDGAMTELNCSSNDLEKLSLNGLTELTDLNCSNNKLRQLDLQNMESLQDLDCSRNWLGELNLNASSDLKHLKCSDNHLYLLDLSPVPGLRGLDACRNRFLELDLSAVTDLNDCNLGTNLLRTEDSFVPLPVYADPGRVLNLRGGHLQNRNLVFDAGSDTIFYDYDTGKAGWSSNVTCAVTVEKEPEETVFLDHLELGDDLNGDGLVYFEPQSDRWLTLRPVPENANCWTSFDLCVCPGLDTGLADLSFGRSHFASDDYEIPRVIPVHTGKETDLYSALAYYPGETPMELYGSQGIVVQDFTYAPEIRLSMANPVIGRAPTAPRSVTEGFEVTGWHVEDMSADEYRPAPPAYEADTPYGLFLTIGIDSPHTVSLKTKVLLNGVPMNVVNADGGIYANCPLPEAGTRPFPDIPEDSYCYAPVIWASEHGFAAGMPSGNFDPQKPCTRAEAMTFLWRVAGEPEPRYPFYNPFTDVPNDSYYTKAVLWAVEEGIAAGVTRNTFAPHQVCTRGQIVTFLHRDFDSTPPASDDNPFTDVKPGKYYYDSVLWAFEHSLTRGVSETRFAPDAPCTRAQIITFLFRTYR